MAKKWRGDSGEPPGEELTERCTISVLFVMRLDAQGRARWKIVDGHHTVYYTHSKSVAELLESARRRGVALSVEYRVDAASNVMIQSASIVGDTTTSSTSETETESPPDSEFLFRP